MAVRKDPGASPSSPTVLLADDEPALRALVAATLGDDYRILLAGDGDEAWRLARDERPDLILLDVQMPGLTGLEVARLIRSDPVLRDTSILMLTSKTHEEDVRAGLEAGANRYLTKPFSPLELLAAVEQLLPAP